MKLAFLCPQSSTGPCGVADYTARLTEELTRENHETRIWNHLPKTSEVAAWKPDRLFVEFTPYLFAPASYGISFALSAWIRRLKRESPCSVALTAHELHYPIPRVGREALEPARWMIGFPQAGQFMALAAAADTVQFTYEVPWERFRRMMPWKSSKLSWVPVGSNIPVIKNPDPAITAAAEGKRVLFQFGIPHPTRPLEYSLAALRAAEREFKDVILVLSGMKLDRPEPGVLDLGFLAPAAVSAWLTRADVVLAPYTDGVSTRRGTVMAALEHGKAVVTTTGSHTDDETHWERFVSLVPWGSSQSFASRVVELLGRPEVRTRFENAARERYSMSFNWAEIARELLEVSQP